MNRCEYCQQINRNEREECRRCGAPLGLPDYVMPNSDHLMTEKWVMEQVLDAELEESAKYSEWAARQTFAWAQREQKSNLQKIHAFLTGD